MPTFPLDPRTIPPQFYLWQQFEATCTEDGWKRVFMWSNGMRLQVGDPLPSGGDDPNFDTCMRCKRKSMKVSKVPTPPAPAKPVGFWKVPTV